MRLTRCTSAPFSMPAAHQPLAADLHKAQRIDDATAVMTSEVSQEPPSNASSFICHTDPSSPTHRDADSGLQPMSSKVHMAPPTRHSAERHLPVPLAMKPGSRTAHAADRRRRSDG